MAVRKGCSELIPPEACHGLASVTLTMACEKGLRHLSAWTWVLRSLEPGEKLSGRFVLET